MQSEGCMRLVNEKNNNNNTDGENRIKTNVLHLR